jgi:hypothetical protein
MDTVDSLTLRELQAQLDLLAGALLGDLAGLLRPRLIVRQAQSAATDGKVWVRLPPEFLGVRLGEGMEIFTALLAHEVGHWLQPLDEVEAAERETGLNHSLVNLLLDIHDEALTASIFPLLGAPLAALRGLVAEKQRDTYESGLAGAASFLEAAAFNLLLGRYGVNRHVPFAIPHEMQASAHAERLGDLCAWAGRLLSYPSRGLPDYFRQLAEAFPDLCQPDLSGLPEDPLGGPTRVDGPGLAPLRRQLADLDGKADLPALVSEQTPSGQMPASAQALALSRQLRRRWQTLRAALSIPAPGRLNRLAAVRGEPLPYAMPVAARGKDAGRTQVVLLLDWSGSMAGAPWEAALKAAQAIALAVQACGGDVRLGLFAAELWHAPDFSVQPLFAAHLGPVTLLEADGDDTSFRWLPHVWQRFPRHRILLLTDGAGYIPGLVLPSQRERTCALLLKVRTNYPEDVAEIESDVSAIAARFVHVDRLDELASAWAALVPRHTLA